MLAPPVWTITDPKPKLLHSASIFPTICGRIRAPRLMSFVHDTRRLTDWGLLLIGDICWGNGLVTIESRSGLFRDRGLQLNLFYLGRNRSSCKFGLTFSISKQFGFKVICSMKALLEFLQIVSAVKRGKFVKVNTIDPFTGSNFKKMLNFVRKIWKQSEEKWKFCNLTQLTHLQEAIFRALGMRARW